MKILFLSRWYPFPADNGARLRIFNLIKQLSVAHEVSLVSFTEADPDHASMRAWCVKVQSVPYRPFKPGSMRAIAGLLSPLPRSVIDTHSEAMQQTAAVEATRFKPDVVIASQSDMALYGLNTMAQSRILEELEVAIIRDLALQKGNWRTRLTWMKTSSYFQRILRGYDACSVVSEVEQANVMNLAPAGKPVEVIPNGVDVAACSRYAQKPAPDTLVYSGALTYHANFDAVDYFLREIMPLIQARWPNVRLFVTGKLEGVPVERLPQLPNVIFTGYLDDVKQKIVESWVTVVPLRVGGGTRLKILESLALGTPVVATSKGAEGLVLQAGRDVLIADSPQLFAERVIELLESQLLREQMSEAGRCAVIPYDWQAIGERMNAFVEHIARGA